MSWRRIPVFATLVMLAAVAVMVRLGFWQIDRLHQKEALLARYAAAVAMSSLAPWPLADERGRARQAIDFRKTVVDCVRVLGVKAVAGHNLHGATGWSHIAQCETATGFPRAEVVLGWSRNPAPRVWTGGKVQGTFRLTGQFDARVVADVPLAGLEANAAPDPNDIPNNHLAYAVQWFLFALTALVIYALALRERLAQSSPERGGGAPEA